MRAKMNFYNCDQFSLRILPKQIFQNYFSLYRSIFSSLQDCHHGRYKAVYNGLIT
jgi:hypothetical protein